MNDAHVQAYVLAKKISAEVVRAAGAGLNAGRIFIAARIKETLSVSAPRRKLKSGGYRATTPAIQGAPMRKLSGRARSSVTSAMTSATTAVVGLNARSDKGFNYPKRHEVPVAGQPGSGQHKFIEPTVKRYLPALKTIVGQGIVVTFGHR